MEEVCKHVIKLNKSCSKAYEYMGKVKALQNQYTQACVYFENAWRLENYRNPQLGYVLGSNQLYAQSYVNAIDTCHKTLAVDPDFDFIKNDVLYKARQHIRI